jgi:hypothetical protein
MLGPGILHSTPNMPVMAKCRERSFIMGCGDAAEGAKHMLVSHFWGKDEL